MDREVLEAALAGLLHDVGKFAQRAGWQKGEHAAVGGEVVYRYIPTQWHTHLYPVMGHHDRPLQGYETKVVALADRLSAGERADEKQEQPRQLLSIFCRVKVEDKEAPAPRYWPLKLLALERETLFPGAEWQEPAVQEGYKALWQEFEKDLEILRQAYQGESDLAAYLESVLLLMQRCTWCIPAAYYRSLPDVSLYDHSRMTAALAACLTGRLESTLDQMLRAPEQSPEPAVLLAGGDLSGVQDFIYTITDRGATSALRGRSFYLQLLTEAAARYVLRRLELPMTNLIYQGGGAFYLLARAGDGDRLGQIQRELSQILLAHHRGDLYLALANAPLAAADFSNGRISDRWADLARALRAAKQRRFAELDGSQLAQLFAPQGHGGNEDRQCQVCGHEHPETEVKRRPADADETEVRMCPPCISYRELGNALRQAAYLWLAETEIPQPPADPLAQIPGGWPDALAALGMCAGLADQAHQIPHNEGRRRVVLALHDDRLEDLRPAAQTATGRRFLVNVTPIITPAEIDKLGGQVDDLPEPGSVKPFSALEAQSTGVQRLGVLRMDVDNLGDMFASGLGGQATLSRIAALSFAISLYFEGWVGHIAEKMNRDPKAKYQDTLYSIYSGGDDLFFVGAWDRVVELARRIRADLAPFAAGHPGIHASAGLVLVGGKYPLAQAAGDAGEAEGRAKQRDGKDALHFLGQTTAWARLGLEDGAMPDLETVYGMAIHLHNLVETKDRPKALLRLLIRLQEQHDRADQKRRERGIEINRAGQEQVLYGPWMWRGAYHLERMAERYKQSNTTHTALVELRERLHEDSFRAIEWIGLAARWAELLGRESYFSGGER